MQKRIVKTRRISAEHLAEAVGTIRALHDFSAQGHVLDSGTALLNMDRLLELLTPHLTEHEQRSEHRAQWLAWLRFARKDLHNPMPLTQSAVTRRCADLAEFTGMKMPSVATIKRWLEELRTDDTQERWLTLLRIARDSSSDPMPLTQQAVEAKCAQIGMDTGMKAPGAATVRRWLNSLCDPLDVARSLISRARAPTSDDETAGGLEVAGARAHALAH
jgi:hypothetical protein